MFRIAVYGCGYVGLVSAACFARLGHDVTCVDTEQMRVADLLQGRIPFYEPGLEELVREQSAAARLHFTQSSREAVRDADMAFIAVGTPTGPTGEADVSYVRQCVLDIVSSCTKKLLIVNKSTVPVETADFVASLISRYAKRPGDIRVASNRVVVGCVHENDVQPGIGRSPSLPAFANDKVAS